jgi:DNA-binding FrmR family transcriptional regulator
MNNRQRRLLEAARSAIAFVLQLRNAPSRITEAMKRLQAAVLGVREAEVRQLSAMKSRHAPRSSVNRAKKILLRKHLDPIAADGLEIFAGLPGLEDSLRVPRIKDSPEKHLEAAKRIRHVADEHAEEFITERNYSEDFLEKFDAAVRDLEAAARVERGAARARYTRATEDVKEEIARVRRALDALDTRILEAYLDDRSTLKLWRRWSRVPAKTGRPKKKKPKRSGATT